MREDEALRLASELLDKLPPVKTEEDLKILSRVLKKITKVSVDLPAWTTKF